MVKKSLRQFTLMATATVTLLLGKSHCAAVSGAVDS
ncbi:Beta-lactamase [Klebsiella pneumoniae]|nr:Beta-lactamase [Klebsiella pneumoniae]